MTFCGVLSLSQVTSRTLVCIGPILVGPIGLGPTQQERRSGQVGPSSRFHQSVSVRSESKRQSVRFGRSKLDNLGPTGLDQDRTGPRPRLSIPGQSDWHSLRASFSIGFHVYTSVLSNLLKASVTIARTNPTELKFASGTSVASALCTTLRGFDRCNRKCHLRSGGRGIDLRIPTLTGMRITFNCFVCS